MCTYQFGAVDVQSEMIGLFNSFYQTPDACTNLIQKQIISMLAHFITVYPEVRTPDFFIFIENFICKFHHLNLFRLYHSLIKVPPFPSPDLLTKIVNDVNSQLQSLQPTDEKVPHVFHFFNTCLKNSLEIDYSPFLSFIPPVLTQLHGDQKVISRLCEFLIIFPHPKPELFQLLIEIAQNCKRDSIHEKLLNIFLKQMYRNIYTQSPEASQIIAEYSKQHFMSQNQNLCGFALTVFFVYQKADTIPYDSNFARFLIERIDWPMITFAVAKLLCIWIRQLHSNNSYEEMFFQLVDILKSEYTNITLVLKYSNRSESSVNNLYTILESMMKAINEFVG